MLIVIWSLSKELLWLVPRRRLSLLQLWASNSFFGLCLLSSPCGVHCCPGWPFIVGTVLSALASAGTWAEDAASAGGAYVLNCVICVLIGKNVNSLFQLTMLRTGVVATSPALGMLQTNQNSPCSSGLYGCCALTALCVLAARHGWCVVSSGQLLFLSFCIGSLLWLKPALFSEEPALPWLLALQD